MRLLRKTVTQLYSVTVELIGLNTERHTIMVRAADWDAAAREGLQADLQRPHWRKRVIAISLLPNQPVVP